MRVIVTGSAGFIGFHVSHALLGRGDEVIGIDNLNEYYNVELKKARLALLEVFPNYTHVPGDISNRKHLESIFANRRPHRVIHLAAQAGVRYSLVNPHAYADSNLLGFVNILECCRQNAVEHLVYASSSSVYGGNSKLPYTEQDNVDHPISLYAATKKANELMAHTYSHLFGLATTGLRFFTVYGPWGRPDMALSLFTSAILAGEPIRVFNQGRMIRDFTFVNDVVQALVRILDKPAEPDPRYDSASPDPANSNAPYKIFNIGNNQPTQLMEYIGALEHALGISAKKEFLPMQAGDVLATAASTEELNKWIGFEPNTTIEYGIGRFVEWYRNYYRI